MQQGEVGTMPITFRHWGPFYGRPNAVWALNPESFAFVPPQEGAQLYGNLWWAQYRNFESYPTTARWLEL
jgi:hypothetical protein